jgi:hypothetical protein
MNLGETGFGVWIGFMWIGIGQWQGFVNMTMNLKSLGISSLAERTVSFSAARS